MKGLFITYPVNYQKDQSGILIKIKGQINVFRKNGIECEEHLLPASFVVKNDKILRKLQWIPFFNIWPRWEYNNIFSSVDFLYMRKPSTFSYYMIDTLKKAKKYNPSLKIYLEIPTYPYDKEMHYGLKKLFLIKEYLYRNRLKSAVDYITLPSFGKLYDAIYDIPVVDFHNGNDFSAVEVIEHEKHDGEFHMICVANFQPTHGYERIIEGVCEYNMANMNTKVYLHMVGEGIELQKYKDIVSTYQKNVGVIFHGYKKGKELSELYNKADVAISALGLYKINNGHISCLKNGEYMAKGIPVIYTGGVDDVPDNCKEFFYCVNNDSSIINVNDIISFYKKLYDEYADDLNKIIREESVKFYDISVSMKPVVEKIKSEYKK